jgi:hypothetical protein
MSDGFEMVTKKALVRILDPDRRLVIDRGFVKAPELFFAKYGNRFSDDKPGKKEIGSVRVIDKWANKSRAAEQHDVRLAARIQAKKEAAAVAAAAPADEAAEEEEVESQEEADVNEKAEGLPLESTLSNASARPLGKKKKRV